MMMTMITNIDVNDETNKKHGNCKLKSNNCQRAEWAKDGTEELLLLLHRRSAKQSRRRSRAGGVYGVCAAR